MHEHHAVHELDIMFLASGDDFGSILGVATNRLLAENMLSRFGRADDPFLA